MNKVTPRIEVKEDDVTYGQFIVEPLQQTFGFTIGNALRRVLMSSIIGSAVTSIQIDGIQHEFQTIPGVKEDVTEFMLNMRNLYVKMADTRDNQPRILTIDVKGRGEVTGADIQCPPEVTVVNPDVYLADISDENAEFKVTMTVERGKGYVLPEKQLNVKRSIGVIPMASIFSPIVKVAYSVDPTRVGHDTNFEKLVIEVYTNGTIRPGEAIVEATGILISQFNLIRSYAGDIEDIPIMNSQESINSNDPKLNTHVEHLEFSHRTANCLRKENIHYVRELVDYTENELLRVRSFGKKSLDEVIDKLAEMGLNLKIEESTRSKSQTSQDTKTNEVDD